MSAGFTMDTVVEFEAAGDTNNSLEVALDTEAGEHGIVLFIRGIVHPDEGEFSHLQIGHRTFELDFEEINGSANRRFSVSEAKRLRDALGAAIQKAEAGHGQ